MSIVPDWTEKKIYILICFECSIRSIDNPIITQKNSQIVKSQVPRIETIYRSYEISDYITAGSRFLISWQWIITSRIMFQSVNKRLAEVQGFVAS